jgi:hypothetical protein
MLTYILEPFSQSYDNSTQNAYNNNFHVTFWPWVLSWGGVLNIEPIYITELTTAAYLGYITRNVKFILGSLSWYSFGILNYLSYIVVCCYIIAVKTNKIKHLLRDYFA